ncbi:hypothetical protein FM107_08260 [Sphingobacterium sp. JB170]|nr:hypothetical protein FM107_08260 [Sphingobacterium sp. JB170]
MGAILLETGWANWCLRYRSFLFELCYLIYVYRASLVVEYYVIDRIAQDVRFRA